MREGERRKLKCERGRRALQAAGGQGGGTVRIRMAGGVGAGWRGSSQREEEGEVRRKGEEKEGEGSERERGRKGRGIREREEAEGGGRAALFGYGNIKWGPLVRSLAQAHSELMEAVMQQWLQTPAGQAAAQEAARLDLNSEEVGQVLLHPLLAMLILPTSSLTMHPSHSSLTLFLPPPR